MPRIELEISPYYGKKFIGMNWYRNCHPYEQNAVKRIYTNKFIKSLAKYKGVTLGKYKVSYKYYYKNTNTDLMNCCAMMDKFFQDALMEAGITKNDNVNNCKFVDCSVAEQDKENPRVKIIVEEVR